MYHGWPIIQMKEKENVKFLSDDLFVHRSKQKSKAILINIENTFIVLIRSNKSTLFLKK